MTTAQSPVDVLRAALERIRDMLPPVAPKDSAQWWIIARNMATVAADALAAATVRGATLTSVTVDEATGFTQAQVDRLAAAPPPAPVPGGMRCPTCGEHARCGRCGSTETLFRKYGCAQRGCAASAKWRAAATPPEVVVGMPDPRCKECGHTKLEHEVAEPHRCVVCLCAAFDDVKTGGKLLASHPLVKPPATPPVQQQGEARRVAHRLVGQLGAHPLPVDVSCSAAEDRIALALMAAWRETGESEQRARNTALRDAAEKLRSHVRELASEHQDADYMTGFAAAALVVELLAAPEMPGTTTRETLPADMAECRVCGKRFRHPAPGTGGQWTCSYECRMGHRAVSTPAPSKGTP